MKFKKGYTPWNKGKGRVIIHKCKYCNKKFKSNKIFRDYCSNQCKYSNRRKSYILLCKYCGNKFQSRRNIKKYCNSNCAGHVSGKISGKVSAENNKKNKAGFWNKNLQDKIMKINRKNATGAFYNKSIQKMNGQKTMKTINKRYGYLFDKIMYSSNAEREMAMNIYYQIEKLILGINCQVNVGSFHYDFLIKKYKCFIEYHPYNRLYDDDDNHLKKYYKIRRDNLEINGLKEYSLILIP